MIIGGVEVSRSVALAMIRGDVEAAREAAGRERRQQESLERAEAAEQGYYHEHGEWRWETMARQQAIAERAEHAEAVRAQREAAERAELARAQAFAAGRRPRTVPEILAEAAMFP